MLFFLTDDSFIGKIRQKGIFIPKKPSLQPEGLIDLYLIKNAYQLPYYPKALFIERVLSYFKQHTKKYQTHAYHIEKLITSHYFMRSKKLDIFLQHAAQLSLINEQILKEILFYMQEVFTPDCPKEVYLEQMQRLFLNNPLLLPCKQLENSNYRLEQKQVLYELFKSNFCKKEKIQFITETSEKQQKNQIKKFYEILSLPFFHHYTLLKQCISGKGSTYALVELTIGSKNHRHPLIFKKFNQQYFNLFYKFFFAYPLLETKAKEYEKILKNILQEHTQGNENALKKIFKKLALYPEVNKSYLKRTLSNPKEYQKLIEHIQSIFLKYEPSQIAQE